MDLLRGDVPPAQVEELAREHGIEFQVTDAVQKQLREAGANDKLLSTLRELAATR